MGGLDPYLTLSDDKVERGMVTQLYRYVTLRGRVRLCVTGRYREGGREGDKIGKT